MSVLIEAVSVVVKRDSIRMKFSGGWSSFQSIVFSQYSMCADSNLATVTFLASRDAYSYMGFLEEMDFIYLQDFVIADQTQGLKDICDWCYIADFKINNNSAMAVTGLHFQTIGKTLLSSFIVEKGSAFPLIVFQIFYHQHHQDREEYTRHH